VHFIVEVEYQVDQNSIEGHPLCSLIAYHEQPKPEAVAVSTLLNVLVHKISSSSSSSRILCTRDPPHSIDKIHDPLCTVSLPAANFNVCI
jgi:hypothetical protein